MSSRDALDAIVAAIDPAMVVVTTAVGNERAGCLVGFHCQSAIDPARYAIWLSKANHTYRVGLRATHFGVHFLGEADFALAEVFGTRSGDDGDKFAGLQVRSGPGGVPQLDACAHWLVVRRVALLDEGGDHVCVTTEVVEAGDSGSLRPLRLSAVAHLTPGHEAEER
jgi:flavin reductase (DIM6/NTAB) family NADH-FMN oxidoreductase RutF